MKLSFVQYTNYCIWFMKWAHSLVQPIESYSVFAGCNHRQKFLFAIIWKSPEFLFLIVAGVISHHFLHSKIFRVDGWIFYYFLTLSRGIAFCIGHELWKWPHSQVQSMMFLLVATFGWKKTWVSFSDHFWCNSTAFLAWQNFACWCFDLLLLFN